jgi:hypothetical protein
LEDLRQGSVNRNPWDHINRLRSVDENRRFDEIANHLGARQESEYPWIDASGRIYEIFVAPDSD